MEKEKNFFAEVQEIMYGTNGPEVEKAAMVLFREAIRSMAKLGHRKFNIANQVAINVNGVAITISEATIRKMKAELVEEGFTISDFQGYNSIEW